MPLHQLIPNAFEILSSAYQKMGELAVEATDPEIIGSPKQPEIENQLIEVSSMYYVAINLVTLNDAGDTIVGISADASVLNALLNNLKSAADLNANILFPTPFSILNFNGSNGGGQNFPVGAPGSLLVSDGITYVVFPKGPDGTVLTSTPTGLVWSSVVGNGIPSGGIANQYLVKNSNTSYDVAWATLTLSKVTDVTASAAEVNILDGALLSTAELNTLVGINTGTTLAAQLAAKQSTTLLNGNFLVGNASNIATSVTPTGDVVFNSAGLFSISPGVIVDADISATAAITRSKIAIGAVNRLVINDGGGALHDADAITADKILISNSVGIPIASTKDASILDFLDLTAPLQGQLDGKLDATITAPALGDLLKYNGTTWINFHVGTIGQILTSNGTDVVWGSATANGVPAGGLAQEYLRKIDGSNYNTEWHTLVLADITDVSTTNTEINLLSGLTVGSSVLNYSAGLTDNIQVQLNSKLSGALSYHALYVGGPGNTAQQVSVGADGSIFTVVAGHPTWQMPPAPGNVTGAPPTTDNAIVRWNLAAGDSIQNSGVLIDDSNNIGGVAALFAENLAVFNQGSLRLCELGSANFVGLRASAVMAADYTITLPDVAPVTNTYLKYDGANYVWAEAAASLTFANGLTELGGVVSWGGPLIDTTIITVHDDTSKPLIFSNTNTQFRQGNYFEIVAGDYNDYIENTGYLSIDAPNGVYMQHLTPDNQFVNIEVNTAAFVIVDGRDISVGIQYQDDYSANFTARSLVDKAYVDNAIPTIADASETVKGIIEIATQAETNAGTDDLRAITPLKLSVWPGNANGWLAISGATLTGVNNITSNTNNQLVWTGSSTSINTGQYYQTYTAIQTARATVSDALFHTFFNNTFIAGANTQSFHQIRSTPTITLGAFTSNSIIGYDWAPVITGTPSTHIGFRSITGMVLIGASNPNTATTLDVQAITGLTLNVARFSSSTNVSVLRVDVGGEVRFGSTSGAYLIAANAGAALLTGTGLRFNAGVGAMLFSTDPSVSNNAMYMFGTSGQTTKTIQSVGGGNFFVINPPINNINTTLSTTNYSIFAVTPAYNFTSGTTVITGIDYNPTLTAIIGLTHYAALFRSGLVGVGTATPTASLQVKGRTTTTSELFRLEDSANTNRFLVLDDGTIKIPTLTNQESYTRTVVIHSDGTLGYSFMDGASVSLTITGTANIDLSTGKTFLLTQSGNVTSFDFSNAVIGKTYTFIITRTTNATFVFAAGKYRLPLGIAPTLTDPTTNGIGTAIDILTCVCNVAGRLDVVISPDFQNN
jgi:hypothetical protein